VFLNQIICHIAKHKQRKHSGVESLKLYIESSVIFFIMGISVRFW